VLKDRRKDRGKKKTQVTWGVSMRLVRLEAVGRPRHRAGRAGSPRIAAAVRCSAGSSVKKNSTLNCGDTAPMYWEKYKRRKSKLKS